MTCARRSSAASRRRTSSCAASSRRWSSTVAARSWCSPAPPAPGRRLARRCTRRHGQPPTCSCATSPRRSSDRNVQVNAIGTNFMDFPGFLRANRAEDPEGRARVEAMVPMRRLGTMDELAHMALPFIDGTSRFTTGQFVGFAGGWVWARLRDHSCRSAAQTSRWRLQSQRIG